MTKLVLRIEAVSPEDMSYAERLLRRALERRTGETVLPFEVESEISELFAELAEIAGQQGAGSEDGGDGDDSSDGGES